MEIKVIAPKFDPKKFADDSLRKLHRLPSDGDRLKHLQVVIQRAYEMGVEDGAKDDTYFD